MQQLYSIKQTAKILGFKSPQSIYNLIKKGELVQVKIGYSSRITGDSIDGLINKHKVS